MTKVHEWHKRGGGTLGKNRNQQSEQFALARQAFFHLVPLFWWFQRETKRRPTLFAGV